MATDIATALPDDLRANPALGTWLDFDTPERVVLRTGKVEIGQGVSTALAQLAADELGVDIEQIVVSPPVTGTSPDQGNTAGSRSIEEAGAAVRQVCAEARALFAEEAANRLCAEVDSLTVEDGRFGTEESDRVSYWDLTDAVSLDVDATGFVRPRPLSPGRYAGRPIPRIDAVAKVTGSAPFIHNLTLAGMLHARVIRPPSPHSRLVTPPSLDASDVQVVRDGSFVAVLAEREDTAIEAAARLGETVEWRIEGRLPCQDDLARFLRTAASKTTSVVDTTDDQPSGSAITATYSRGFVAHGAIGPSCALAMWEGDELHVWSSTQGPYNLRRELSRAFDMDPGAVRVEFVEGAGCYGHNGADDATFEAALIAQHIPGVPVRLQWSREEEMAWEPYGPAATTDLSATLGHDGSIARWTVDIWSNGNGGRVNHSTTGINFISAALREHPAEREPSKMGGVVRNLEPGYDIPQVRATVHHVLDNPIRTSSLRALGAHLNVFAAEGFMDELAEETGQDPVAFRLRHLGDERGRRVVERVAEEASWGRRLPQDHGLGLGYARFKATSGYCAVVAEVEASESLRVIHLTLAVDVGFVINPTGLEAQVAGGAVQSTSWSTLEEIHFTSEAVQSASWDTYPIMRFSDAPTVRVVLVGAEENPPLGAGEIAQGPTAAAIGNALHHAIGLRVRDLPLTNERIRRAATGI